MKLSKILITSSLALSLTLNGTTSFGVDAQEPSVPTSLEQSTGMKNIFDDYEEGTTINILKYPDAE